MSFFTSNDDNSFFGLLKGAAKGLLFKVPEIAQNAAREVVDREMDGARGIAGKVGHGISSARESAGGFLQKVKKRSGDEYSNFKDLLGERLDEAGNFLNSGESFSKHLIPEVPEVTADFYAKHPFIGGTGTVLKTGVNIPISIINSVVGAGVLDPVTDVTRQVQALATGQDLPEYDNLKSGFTRQASMIAGGPGTERINKDNALQESLANVGRGLEPILNAVTGGEAGAAEQGAKTLLARLWQGSKIGAKFGAIQGAATGFQENKDKPLGEDLANTALTAGESAGIGSLFGLGIAGGGEILHAIKGKGMAQATKRFLEEKAVSLSDDTTPPPSGAGAEEVADMPTFALAPNPTLPEMKQGIKELAPDIAKSTDPQEIQTLLQGAENFGLDQAAQGNLSNLLEHATKPEQVEKTAEAFFKGRAPGSVHPEDLFTMTDFIDYARGKSKLVEDSREAVQLEIDARRIADHYGINTDQTNKQLAAQLGNLVDYHLNGEGQPAFQEMLGQIHEQAASQPLEVNSEQPSSIPLSNIAAGKTPDQLDRSMVNTYRDRIRNGQGVEPIEVAQRDSVVHRPEHQAQIEQALNAGDTKKAAEIIDALPKNDPYKASMQSFLQQVDSEYQPEVSEMATFVVGEKKLIDNLYKDSEELSKRKGKVAQNEPYVPSGQGSKEAPRGSEAIISRLMTEFQIGRSAEGQLERAGATGDFLPNGSDLIDKARTKIPPEQIATIQRFIQDIGNSMFDNVGINIFKEGPSQGRFNFGTDMVQLFKNQVVDNGGKFDRTTIHELWHSLSKNIPEKDLARVNAQYNKEARAYIKENPWFFDLVGKKQLTESEGKAFLKKYPEQKDMIRLAEDSKGKPAYKVQYSTDNYRYSSLDEWFAETLTDKSLKRFSDMDTPVKGIIGFGKKIFSSMVDGVTRIFGRDHAQTVLRNFLDHKYDEVQRGTTLRKQVLEDFLGRTGQTINGSQMGDTLARNAAFYDVQDGNHRLQAAKEEGLDSIPIKETTLNERMIQSLSEEDQAKMMELLGKIDDTARRAQETPTPEVQEAAKGKIEDIKAQIDDLGKKAAIGSLPDDHVATAVFGQESADNLLTKQSEKKQAFGQQALEEQQQAERQYKYVRSDPLNFNVVEGKPKATAAEIRESYSGLKNGQIVRGNQLADGLKKVAPEEMRAITFFREAKGNEATLRGWLLDPDQKLDPYRADIEKALSLSDEGKQASAVMDDYYKEAGDVGQRVGFLKALRQDYNNRLYKEGDKPVVDAQGGIKRTTSHAKERYYETIVDAIKNDKVPATTDASELLRFYNEDFAKVNANNQLLDSLQKTGMGSWKEVGKNSEGESALTNVRREIPIKDKNGDAVIGDDGNQIVSRKEFVVPDFLKTGLKAITDPDLINKIDRLREIKKYQGLVKTIDLSVSLFHHFTMLMQGLYQTKMGLDIPKFLSTVKNGDFQEMERHFADHGGITSTIDANKDILRSLKGDKSMLGKVLRAPGIKQAFSLSEKNNEFLFGKMQKWLKVTDYATKVSAWTAKHPDASPGEIAKAARGYARQINAAYGGLNWEALGVTKTTQSVARLLLLAPDWTYSNVELAKQALSGGTAGQAARSHLASALIGGAILTEGLSYMLNGHTTDKNEPGHEYDVEVRPGVYISFFRGGIGDLIKWGNKVAQRGPLSGTSMFVQGKGAPFARTGLGLLTNTDYQGSKIATKDEGFAGNTLASLQYTLNSSGPIPFGVRPTTDLADKGNTDPASYALVASGLATKDSGSKKSKGGKGSGRKYLIK